MARRGALEAVLGALGGGFSGYARDQQVRYGQEQDALDREERRKRELADALAAAEQRKISLFQSGLEEAAPLTERAGNMGRASQAVQAVSGMQAPGMPVGMSAVSRALAGASSGMQSDISRGRKLSVDGTDYVQPFSRTPDGRAERERMQAASDDRVEAMRQGERDKAQGQQRLAEIRLQNEGRTDVAEVRGPTGRASLRPTEAQEKSFLFSTRMNAANPIIERYGPTARLDRISAALAATNPLTRAIANRALTPEEQQLVVAIRQFAEPILRKNTGAAFNEEEIGWVEQQIIPVSGDDEETQKYKAESRLREIEAFNALASPVRRYNSQIPNPVTSANPMSAGGGSAADRLRGGGYP